MIDPKLKEWATERQAQVIDAINEHGSQRKAAKALGVAKGTVDDALKKVRRKAAIHGYAPECDMHKPVPDAFVVRGVSTLYDKHGNAQAQWVKTRLDDQKLEETIRAAVDALMQDVPKARQVAKPTDTSEHLANLYTLTDTHIGMKSWAAETGADWDLEIAEKTLTTAFHHLIAASPNAELGIVNFLGDILHYDSLDAVTPQHRNLLDSDSRFPKMVAVAVRTLRVIINAALRKHSRVVVVFSEGNHEPASTVWLRHLFGLLFELEPRISVIDNVTPYTAIQHGKVMLSFHHGHLSRNDSLPLLFAATYPEMWGSTTRRYCHTGHRHHAEEKEHSGMTVVQHSTIAARDAYAARGGWMADRSIISITYHAEYGQVARSTVVPEMFDIREGCNE